MLFLNKLLPLFVLPLGATVLLVVFGLWRKKRWPIVAGLVLLYASSTPFVGQRLIGWLESFYPVMPVAAAERADAIVVLGGIFGPPVEPGYVPNFSESAERLEAGIRLVQADKAPWLVFTGGRIPWKGRRRVEGEDSRAAALARGVPSERILLTPEVGNTADEARAVAAMMRERQWRTIILVTTAWHMPRAAWLFRKAGVNFRAFPVDLRRDRRRPVTLLDFLPEADALVQTETTLRECYGNAFYRLFR
ncbi:MAG TPA: YdcF family protein [Lacunisphaera sp.]|nr:YdcF family protein [Lacunisphaera sp.]